MISLIGLVGIRFLSSVRVLYSGTTRWSGFYPQFCPDRAELPSCHSKCNRPRMRLFKLLARVESFWFLINQMLSLGRHWLTGQQFGLLSICSEEIHAMGKR